MGLTSKAMAMQHQVGIDTPDSGILLDYMVVAPGEALRAAELLSPRIEAEIAFRLGTTLADSVADNAACARFVIGEAVPMPSWDLRA